MKTLWRSETFHLEGSTFQDRQGVMESGFVVVSVSWLVVKSCDLLDVSWTSPAGYPLSKVSLSLQEAARAVHMCQNADEDCRRAEIVERDSSCAGLAVCVASAVRGPPAQSEHPPF